MQKKLLTVAVASALAMPVIAQAQVTFSGNMDLGITSNEIQAGGVDTSTQTAGLHNGSSTSNFAITAVEDLGGGLRAKIYIETDPPFGTNTGAAFSNAPNYLELSGGFGSVSLGLINNFALSASSTSQPFGTGGASGYSGSFGRLDGLNTIGVPTAVAHGGNGARDIRVNRTFQYKTPDMSGFSAGIQYKIGNSDPGNTTAGPESAAIGAMQFGLGYSRGALKIAAATSSYESEGAVLFGTSNDITHNMLGVNYTFGAITVYGGYTTSEGENSADVDSESMNAAVKWQVSPTMWIGANIVEVDDKRTGVGDGQDRDLMGLGLDYSLSKLTTAYIRYESGDNDKLDSTSGDFTRIAVGLRKSF